MSASVGFSKQEDGFDKLLKLATLNATDIKAAGEEHRRQIQLTQEEQAKVTEARNYITRYSALDADLSHRESQLAESRLSHTREKEDFAKYVASENVRLETLAAKIDPRDKASAVNAARTEQALKDAAGLKAQYERQHQNALADINTASNANIEIGKTLAAENKRLSDWEATLKAKAERIRQQAANF